MDKIQSHSINLHFDVAGTTNALTKVDRAVSKHPFIVYSTMFLRTILYSKIPDRRQILQFKLTE